MQTNFLKHDFAKFSGWNQRNPGMSAMTDRLTITRFITFQLLSESSERLVPRRAPDNLNCNYCLYAPGNFLGALQMCCLSVSCKSPSEPDEDSTLILKPVLQTAGLLPSSALTDPRRR